MTATQGNLAGLSRYIFGTPRWYASLTLALALAAVTGVAAFDSAYPLDDAWRGVFFVGLPTVAAAVFTVPIDQMLGGHLTRDWASLLALVSELVVILVLTVAQVVRLALGLPQQFILDGLLVALAAIFALRLLIVVIISRQSTLRALAPASVQTVAAAVLLFVYSGTLQYLQVGGPLLDTLFARPEKAPIELQYSIFPFDFVLLAIICIVHASAVWGFLAVIDRPWRSSLGVSVLDFIRGFIGHIAEGSRELEDFFEDIGEDAIVPVTVLSFRRPDGEEKARFVLPMIHPGPMGEIGGGNLPVRVAKQTDGLGFPPHATAGHDFNLVTEREVDSICETIDSAYQRIEYSDTATKGVRITEGSATLTGHAFGSKGLLVNTFSPDCADDVAFPVGLSAMSEAHSEELDDVLLVDAHNCNNGLEGEDLGHVVPGSERSFDLIEGAGRLGKRLASMDQHSVRLGTAWDETPWEPEDGIGPLGIRVAFIEAGNHLTAYVLIDGNNMDPGLRERIIERIDVADTAEVMTSDTHVVNTVEAENQVGGGIPTEELLDRIGSLISEALDDLEPVEAGMETEKVEVTVFGNDRTETLASHANAMVPMATALAGAFIFAVLSVSVLIFLIASGTAF
ncbi:MAG: putative membrane protein [Haloarculaceae archaeon]|jgi:putative membrane protein